jgi:hypothetical protein
VVFEQFGWSGVRLGRLRMSVKRMSILCNLRKASMKKNEAYLIQLNTRNIQRVTYDGSLLRFCFLENSATEEVAPRKRIPDRRTSNIFHATGK